MYFKDLSAGGKMSKKDVKKKILLQHGGGKADLRVRIACVTKISPEELFQ